MADHQRGRAASIEGDYPLTVGKAYAVVGMGIAETVLDLLVRDDWGGPCFAPSGMFELFTAPVPAGWHFSLRSGVRASGRDLWSDPIVALWGYRELVEQPSHLTALLERDAQAQSVFDAYIASAELLGDA